MMVGMSSFTLDSSLLASALSSTGVGTGILFQKHDLERKALTDELLAIVQECQRKYGGKTELATESDSRILLLCDTWERALSHGLKSTNSVLKNVTDLVAGSGPELPVFWNFAFKHLTNHEKERFSTLRHVWTNGGKGKSLLRAVLNERALERYMLMWLGDPTILQESYESWALMRDPEITGLLPNMAAGLSTILFAIAIDAPELNAPTRLVPEKTEPIIATQPPAGRVRKTNIVQREILDETTSQPILNLSRSPVDSASLSRTANINIVREHSAATTEEPREAYSVEDALNSLTILRRSKSRESTSGKASSSVEPQGSGPFSPDRALEASEDFSIMDISNISSSASTAANTTATTTASNTSSSENYASDSSMHHLLLYSNHETETEHDPERCTALVDKLKRRLTDSEDRCQMMEARVAELSLENNRLRMLSRSHRLSLMHFQISIPKAILRTPVSGRRRAHYCYEIRISPSMNVTNSSTTTPSSFDNYNSQMTGQVTIPRTTVANASVGNDDSWSVFRRYSEFYRLHKRLQKEYSNVKTLDFPPKKKIGNMNAQFVEQRRQRLQVYLNSLFITVLPEVSACSTRSQLEQVFPFLKDGIH
ncbi:sorting nexin-29 [Uranotaenia lowii]|uniref:sorting nexin-29 n=1 Tax=Uranotaenia lowii TaxID=190385 RepID=UPI0024787067|nr:sorting nexin-29 [Uranotaenia lowii]